MSSVYTEFLPFFREAIRLAILAEQAGNLPIAALLILDGEVIASGQNAIWSPEPALTRHAEMEALRSVPNRHWPRSRQMTLVTTLEPCVMCAGAILLHNIGRLVFGASDPSGGVAASFDSLPPYFRQEYARIQWLGPAYPEECQPLYSQIVNLETDRGTTLPTPPADA